MVKHTGIFLQLLVVNLPKIKSSKYAYGNIKSWFCESESDEIHSSICGFMTTPRNLQWWMCSIKKCTFSWLLLQSEYNIKMKGWGLIPGTALVAASNKGTGNWRTIFILHFQWYVPRKSPYCTLYSDTSLALTHPLEFSLKDITSINEISLHKDFSSTSKHNVRDTTEYETEWLKYPYHGTYILHMHLGFMCEIMYLEFPNEQKLKWRKIKNEQY